MNAFLCGVHFLFLPCAKGYFAQKKEALATCYHQVGKAVLHAFAHAFGEIKALTQPENAVVEIHYLTHLHVPSFLRFTR